MVNKVKVVNRSIESNNTYTTSTCLFDVGYKDMQGNM